MSFLADSILNTVRQDHLNLAANKMLQWQSIYLWRPVSVFDWCCRHPFLSGTWGNWLQTSFPWLISRTLHGYHASQRYTHTQSAQLWVVWQRIWQRKHTCISVSYTSAMSQNTMLHCCSQALNWSTTAYRKLVRMAPSGCLFQGVRHFYSTRELPPPFHTASYQCCNKNTLLIHIPTPHPHPRCSNLPTIKSKCRSS